MDKKFAIIGKGFIYQTHVDAIKKIGGEIIDVVKEENGKDAWKEMVKKTDADYIVILTPNDLHFEMAKFAAENNKIVLCEKPLTIKSSEAKILADFPNVFTVVQLRHHPFTEKLKSEIRKDKFYEIEMDISVHRDEEYYKSWKGDSNRSGGLLFNLGIHYFDLLLYLFGPVEEVLVSSLSDKTGVGVIKGKNYICNWRVSTDTKKEEQRRLFKIDGVNYNFSSKDNLAYENLHTYVYKDLLQKKGVSAEEVLPSIELIEKLYASCKK